MSAYIAGCSTGTSDAQPDRNKAMDIATAARFFMKESAPD
jgi:hypothetical protein